MSEFFFCKVKSRWTGYFVKWGELLDCLFYSKLNPEHPIKIDIIKAAPFYRAHC